MFVLSQYALIPNYLFKFPNFTISYVSFVLLYALIKTNSEMKVHLNHEYYEIYELTQVKLLKPD